MKTLKGMDIIAIPFENTPHVHLNYYYYYCYRVIVGLNNAEQTIFWIEHSQIPNLNENHSY